MMQNWFGGRWFDIVHGRNLIYNTCWEDPRLDRVALELGPDDTVMVITSAGCNALDYVIQEPAGVHAVDMNHRQNALLELKMAGIRGLEYEDFFEMFGRGRMADPKGTYRRLLRPHLSPGSQDYWDRKFPQFFRGRGWRDSFYFHGTSGVFARLINTYIDRVAKIRPHIEELLACKTVEEQKVIYEEFREVFWSKFIRWIVGRNTTLSLLGVPKAQRIQVEKHYAGGIAGFMEDCVENVFAKLPLSDNYFWRVYLTGRYTEECCPEYLKPENFYKLKNGLVDRVHVHTSSILEFLKKHGQPISRFVLLDHMDWLSTVHLPILQQEWQGIVDSAAPRTRILWRSGGLRTEFVDRLPIMVGRQHCQVHDVLRYHKQLADELHQKDRVHTYASFYIADLLPA